MTYKLYFRYGTMNSSKTANLIMISHFYKSRNKKVVIIKPSLDKRFGINIIKSRSGLEEKADILIEKNSSILKEYDWEKVNIVLVDEVNFLSPEQVDDLRKITSYTPVIAYGLRTDYKVTLFPGSKRMMELADSIEEIKTVCTYCCKKAIINMKHFNGKGIKIGNDKTDLGCEEKYLAVCWICWCKNTS